MLSLFTVAAGCGDEFTAAVRPGILKGMALRSSGTVLEAMRLLGASAPVAMPQSDVPDALQKGVVKGPGLLRRGAQGHELRGLLRSCHGRCACQ